MDQNQPDVFLSYNEKDRDSITYLAIQLRNYGIKPWLAYWNLVPGKPWQEEVVEVLEQVKSCVVILGSNGISEWQEREISRALDRQAKTKSEFRVIPVLLPGAMENGEASAEHSFKKLGFLYDNTWIEFQNSLDETEPMRRLVAGIKGKQPGPQPSAAPTHSAPKIKVCPYRGLEPFDIDHAAFFYGREALVQKIIRIIKDHLTAEHRHRFLAIIGPSGSGKSSLSRAGVVYALKEGAFNGSRKWPMIIFNPGSDPMRSLAISLATYQEEPAGHEKLLKMEKNLLTSPDSLEFELRAALGLRQPDDAALLVIDQFEQIFTLCKDEKKRNAFISALLEVARPGASRIYIMIAMRADFYSKCFKFDSFANLLTSNQVAVPPMSRENISSVITEPAKRVKCSFETGLVARLLSDLEGASVGLPLLEHTLLELWRRRDGDRMTHRTYEEIGGIAGALEQHAESTFEMFSDEEKRQCKRIFMRLVQPSDSGEYTKRQTLITELIPPHNGDSLARESAIRVLQTLTSGRVRLVTTNGAMIAEGRGFAEVSHEALIKNWSRLRRWVDEDKEGFRILHQLRQSTKNWLEHKENKSFLYQGSRLTDALAWTKDKTDDLSEDERRFLRESSNRRRALKGGVVAAVILITVIAIFAVIEAIRERQLNTEIQRRLDTVRRIQLIGDLRKAWLNEAKMQQWLNEPKPDTSQADKYEKELYELRQAANAVEDPQAAWGFHFNNAENQERYDSIAESDYNIKQLALVINEARSVLNMLRNERRDTKETDDAVNRWRKAKEDIKANPLYKGLEIEPQLGLIPLGENPISHLYEFAHYMTGSLPEQKKDGHWVVNSQTAIILVLIPAEEVQIGAKKPEKDKTIEEDLNIDMYAEPQDLPKNKVKLSPFFISKYEMTQGQWLRATLNNPSGFPINKQDPERLRYPVESISWHTAQKGLNGVKLVLPTEAQWEYAARGGKNGRWTWASINDESQVQYYGHISHKDNKDQTSAVVPFIPKEQTSVVGQYLPNGFGLFDTIGNVWEWCQDNHCPYEAQADPETGLRHCDSSMRIFRGGSLHSPPLNARTAMRRSYPPSFYNPNQGIRPARGLDN